MSSIPYPPQTTLHVVSFYFVIIKPNINHVQMFILREIIRRALNGKRIAIPHDRSAYYVWGLYAIKPASAMKSRLVRADVVASASKFFIMRSTNSFSVYTVYTIHPSTYKTLYTGSNRATLHFTTVTSNDIYISLLCLSTKSLYLSCVHSSHSSLQAVARADCFWNLQG